MPTRRTSELHRGRISTSGGRYFVTCCTQNRRGGLDAPALVESLLNEIRASDDLRDTFTWACVVMPDHLHWLLELGDRLSIGQVVGKLKRQTGIALAANGLSWQRDFFEHRLRSGESAESYARYVYLNPFRRARKHSTAAPPLAPVWWTSQPERLRFLGLLNDDGTPPAEWLDDRPFP